MNPIDDRRRAWPFSTRSPVRSMRGRGQVESRDGAKGNSMPTVGNGRFTRLPWVWTDRMSSTRAAERIARGTRQSSERVALRAVTTSGSPESVYLWLCQLRRAPYSYDWIDNFGHRSLRAPIVEMARLHCGQDFMTIFTLVDFERGRCVSLRMKPGWPTRAFGAIALDYLIEPAEGGRTSLIAVMRMPMRSRRPRRQSSRLHERVRRRLDVVIAVGGYRLTSSSA